MLADRVALAIVERGPTSGTRLALVVGARKSSVLAELRSDPRFVATGEGRATVWRLASAVERTRAVRAGEPVPGRAQGDTKARTHADFEPRLDALEATRRRARNHATTARRDQRSQ
jgi:hypothetical protein